MRIICVACSNRYSTSPPAEHVPVTVQVPLAPHVATGVPLNPRAQLPAQVPPKAVVGQLHTALGGAVGAVVHVTAVGRKGIKHTDDPSFTKGYSSPAGCWCQIAEVKTSIHLLTSASSKHDVPVRCLYLILPMHSPSPFCRLLHKHMHLHQNMHPHKGISFLPPYLRSMFQ
jgi:hypothetical protein